MVAGEAALARVKTKADLRDRQMDVTYIHLPGYSRWYAMMVIDYYSRYLLACHLANCYWALESKSILNMARYEAERLCGSLEKRPFLVTDVGPSFMPAGSVSTSKDMYSHVRIQHRVPIQLGQLERFCQTLKAEKVYRRLYDRPFHARQCPEEFRLRYNAIRSHLAFRPSKAAIRAMQPCVLSHPQREAPHRQ